MDKDALYDLFSEFDVKRAKALLKWDIFDRVEELDSVLGELLVRLSQAAA